MAQAMHGHQRVLDDVVDQGVVVNAITHADANDRHQCPEQPGIGNLIPRLGHPHQ